MNTSQPVSSFSRRIRAVATLMTLIFGLHGMVPIAAAGMIPSSLITAGDARTADIATLQKALETKVVQHRLTELGFSPEEINDRIAYADDAELRQLAMHSENLMAGGGGGILVTVLVIILLVLLIQRIAAVESAPSDLLMA
ncbi:MAG: PA2779 family protein [Verrucomicrobia bacterium]|nr:PA2779 family protein [Verrucomicrobiota bacterium]MCH8528897.1 PA2779 family protein [Kiritimatiellia bacterium]